MAHLVVLTWLLLCLEQVWVLSQAGIPVQWCCELQIAQELASSMHPGEVQM